MYVSQNMNVRIIYKMTYKTIIAYRYKSNWSLMQQKICKLLNLSLHHKSITQITQQLEQCSKMQGYTPTLLQIINGNNYAEHIVLSAATQLKNVIRGRWTRQPNDKGINLQDRLYILHNLLPTFISKHHKSTTYKLLKDVLSYIGKSLINTIQQVLSLLEEGIKVKGCLMYLLGIVASYSHVYRSQEAEHLGNVVKFTLPRLMNLLRFAKSRLQQIENELTQNLTQQKIKYYLQQRKSYQQIEYLSIKFVCKSIQPTISNAIKPHLQQWVKLVLSKINNYNQQIHKTYIQTVDDNLVRDSYEYFYYHGRKWSAKFLQRIYNKIYTSSTHNTSFHSTHGFNIAQTLLTTMYIPQHTQIRYYFLKCIDTIYQVHATTIEQHYKIYSFQVLLGWLRLSQKDVALGKQHAVQFIQIEYCQKYSQNQNVRSISTRLWLNFAKINSNFTNPNKIIQGEILYEHLVFLQQSLRGQNPTTKQICMYLLYKMKPSYQHCPIALEIIQQIIIDIIFPIIQSSQQPQQFILRTRAINLIQAYINIIPEEYLQTIKDWVIYLLIRDQSQGETLVKLAAVKCYGVMLKYVNMRQLGLQQVEPILHNLVSVIIKHEYEQALNCLTQFIAIHLTKIQQCGPDLIKFLTQMFFLYMNKDITQSNTNLNYNENVYNLATGVIRIIRIMSACRDQYLVGEIQKQILMILQVHYGLPQEASSCYNQDIVYMLENYLEKRGVKQAIGVQFWFYYMVIVCKLVGLPKQCQQYVDELELDSPKKCILKQCQSHGSQYDYQLYVKLLRRYIKQMDPKQELRGYQMTKGNMFQANVLEILFFMVVRIYRDKNCDVQVQVRSRMFGSYCLMFLVQRHGGNLSKQAFATIWAIIIANVGNLQLIQYLSKSNLQLFCLSFWAAPNIIIKCIDRLDINNKLNNFLDRLFQINNYHACFQAINEAQQAKRVILGLTNYLLYCKNRVNMRKKINVVTKWLFDYLIFLVKEEYKDAEFNDYQKIIEYQPQSQDMANSKLSKQDECNLQQIDFTIDISPSTIKQAPFYSSQMQLDECYQSQSQSQQKSIDEVTYFLQAMKQLHRIDKQYFEEIISRKYNVCMIDILGSCPKRQYEMYEHLCEFREELSQEGV